MKSPERRASLSALEPLRNSVYLRLWSASLASNTGTWMHDVAEAWLMTSLTVSPLMVAMIQVGESLPVFLLALPAGALADVLDRRRILMAAQVWLAVCAAALGLLAIAGHATPAILIFFAFLMGIGAAVSAPAWQSAIPEVVGREQLPSAIALNSVGFNLSRLIGPALGGLMVASVGSGPVFLLNAISFGLVFVAVLAWKHERGAGQSPPELVSEAMIAGLRYVRHAPAVHAVFWRSGVFIFFGSALWSLLPVMARREIGVGSGSFGLLIGSLGLGASVMAIILPRVRLTVTTDDLVVGAQLLFAACLALLASSRTVPQACASMFLAGTAWITLLSTFNTAAQRVVPDWVRGRALSLYQVVFQAGTILGSVAWGAAAQHVGTRAALFMTAGGLAVAAFSTRRFSLQAGERLDTSLVSVWEEPVVPLAPTRERGPVLVLVEYKVPEADHSRFAERMMARSLARRRDGATNWGLFTDAAAPSRVVEMFTVQSWGEHLRQHERTTASDMADEIEVKTFYSGDKPPAVRHLISIQPIP